MREMKRKIYRILDANYNRAKEALRVSEDMARFVMDDAALTRRFKRCRHRISQIMLQWPVPYRELVLARDAVRDVGKNHVISDRKKISLRDLLIANLKRGQESLRVMEEMSKIFSAGSSHALRKLRFEVYELEKKALRKF